MHFIKFHPLGKQTMAIVYLTLLVLSFLVTLEARQREEEYTPITRPYLTEIKSFKNIPMADEIGLVLQTVPVTVPQIKDVYNPSMIKTDTGYCIAFRYDPPWDGVSFKKAKLGLVNLDKQFRTTGEFHFLRTLDESAEDPKLFMVGNKCFVSYTHLTSWGKDYSCNIGMTSIDLKSQSAKKSWQLQYHNGPKEKNWTPFSYAAADGVQEMYFIYEYNPFHIVKVKSPITGTIEHPFIPQPSPLLNAWESRWGKIRGGTPAILLDSGEYIAFFHSCFREKCLLWYVMGAILFDGKPPFALKKISSWPIFFKNIYNTPIAPGKNPILRNCFPGGVVEETLQEKKVFHVIYGENDTSMKVVTIDREQLIVNMHS